MCWPLREQARSHPGLRRTQISCPAQIPCGSELARESGVSVSIDVECAGRFASKPAPTLVCGERRFRVQPRSLVGASLLAKAVCPSALMLNVLAASRASPLPPWSAVNADFVSSPAPLGWAVFVRCSPYACPASSAISRVDSSLANARRLALRSVSSCSSALKYASLKSS